MDDAVKVVTWNLNSIRSRLERLPDYLKREQPDVVALQELKCIDGQFPYDAIESMGYKAAVHGQKTYNGVAVLTKVGMNCRVESIELVNNISIVAVALPNTIKEMEVSIHLDLKSKFIS